MPFPPELIVDYFAAVMVGQQRAANDRISFAVSQSSHSIMIVSGWMNNLILPFYGNFSVTSHNTWQQILRLLLYQSSMFHNLQVHTTKILSLVHTHLASIP